MSTRSWDSSTVEGCLAELAHQRAESLRIHKQDCQEKVALLHRAKRAEAMLALERPVRAAEVQAVLEVFANASPDDTCGSLTARTESCSYWAQALAQKLVRT